MLFMLYCKRQVVEQNFVAVPNKILIFCVYTCKPAFQDVLCCGLCDSPNQQQLSFEPLLGFGGIRDWLVLQVDRKSGLSRAVLFFIFFRFLRYSTYLNIFVPAGRLFVLAVEGYSHWWLWSTLERFLLHIEFIRTLKAEKSKYGVRRMLKRIVHNCRNRAKVETFMTWAPILQIQFMQTICSFIKMPVYIGTHIT